MGSVRKRGCGRGEGGGGRNFLPAEKVGLRPEAVDG